MGDFKITGARTDKDSEAGLYFSAYSPDGKYIAISNGGPLKIRQTSTGRIVAGLTNRLMPFPRLPDLSPNGKEILTVTAVADSAGKRNAKIMIWNDTHNRNWKALCNGDYAAYSQDGKYIVVANGQYAYVFDALTKHLLKEFKNDNVIESLSISPDGKYIMIGHRFNSSDKQLFHFWQFADSRSIREIKDSNIYKARFSTDSRNILTFDRRIEKYGNKSVSIREGKVWQFPEMKVISEVKDSSDLGYGSMFSPDGKNLITIDYYLSLSERGRRRHTFYIKLWDVANKQLVKEIHTHSPLQYSGDGKYLLAFADSIIQIWNGRNGEFIKESKIKDENVIARDYAFSSDGSYVVTTGKNTLRKWNVETGELLYTFVSVDSTDFI